MPMRLLSAVLFTMVEPLLTKMPYSLLLFAVLFTTVLTPNCRSIPSKLLSFAVLPMTVLPVPSANIPSTFRLTMLPVTTLDPPTAMPSPLC